MKFACLKLLKNVQSEPKLNSSDLIRYIILLYCFKQSFIPLLYELLMIIHYIKMIIFNTHYNHLTISYVSYIYHIFLSVSFTYFPIQIPIHMFNPIIL